MKGVPLVVRVLVEPLLRVLEDDDHLGDLEPVDEVVEHGLDAREVEEVTTVVDHQQRVASGVAVPRRQVQADVSDPSPGATDDVEILDGAPA